MAAVPASGGAPPPSPTTLLSPPTRTPPCRHCESAVGGSRRASPERFVPWLLPSWNAGETLAALPLVRLRGGRGSAVGAVVVERAAAAAEIAAAVFAPTPDGGHSVAGRGSGDPANGACGKGAAARADEEARRGSAFSVSLNGTPDSVLVNPSRKVSASSANRSSQGGNRSSRTRDDMAIEACILKAYFEV